MKVPFPYLPEDIVKDEVEHKHKIKKVDGREADKDEDVFIGGYEEDFGE